MFKITQLTNSVGHITYAVVNTANGRIMFNSKHRTECARWMKWHTPKCMALTVAAMCAICAMVMMVNFIIMAAPVWRAEAAISRGVDYTIVTEELSYRQCCLLDYYLHQ